MIHIEVLNKNPMNNIGKPKNHNLKRISQYEVLLTMEGLLGELA